MTLETFYHLLEIGGTDFNKTGTKANAARLASYITKIPEPACKNYATHRDVNINTHKEEIVKINSQLQALSLKPI